MSGEQFLEATRGFSILMSFDLRRRVRVGRDGRVDDSWTDLELELARDMLEGAPTRRIGFRRARGILLPEDCLQVMELIAEDVSDRQWERVRYRISDVEGDFRLLCQGFEILGEGTVSTVP